MERQKVKQKRLAWLEHELSLAYNSAKKGKSKKPEVIAFEKIAKKEIKNLAMEIYTRAYTPRSSTVFIVNKPVKREIFAAAFRDRIVHHFLFNQVEPWWDRRFIADNYSCRKGKGTLYGIKRLNKHIRSASSNYTKETFVLKLDLQGYFMSLNRKKLYNRAIWGLNRQYPLKGFEFQMCKFLWKVIIFNDPIKECTFTCPLRAWQGLPASKSLFRQPKGQGVAIGNLTSQLVSNIYLDQLDRYITFNLGFKHYGRYVDDFYLVANSKHELKSAIPKIDRYLKTTLELTLHPKKIYLQNINKGIPFLGAVVYPFRIHPGKRIRTNAKIALEDLHCSIETEASYKGLVKHFKHYKFLNKDIDYIRRKFIRSKGKMYMLTYNKKGIIKSVYQ